MEAGGVRTLDRGNRLGRLEELGTLDRGNRLGGWRS